MSTFTVFFFWNEVAQSNKKQPQEPFERISWFLILTHWKTYQGARSARGCGIDGVWAPQRWGDVIVRWEDLSWWFETSMISTEQFSVDFSKVFPSNSLKLSVIVGPKSMSSVEIKAWTHCMMFFFSVNSQGLNPESSSYPTVPRSRCKDKIKLCVNRNLFWAFGKWVNLAKLSFQLKQARRFIGVFWSCFFFWVDLASFFLGPAGESTWRSSVSNYWCPTAKQQTLNSQSSLIKVNLCISCS